MGYKGIEGSMRLLFSDAPFGLAQEGHLEVPRIHPGGGAKAAGQSRQCEESPQAAAALNNGSRALGEESQGV